MKTFIFIYFLGFSICGLLYLTLFKFRFFKEYYEDRLDQVCSELTDEEKRLLDNIDYDKIELIDIFVASLFSWVGIIYLILMLILIYFDNKFNN